MIEPGSKGKKKKKKIEGNEAENNGQFVNPTLANGRREIITERKIGRGKSSNLSI